MHSPRRKAQTVAAVTLLLAGYSLVIGCSAKQPQFLFTVQDRPTDQSFVVRLQSTDTQTICVPVDAWPSRGYAPDQMSVRAGGSLFPSTGPIIGRHCPDGCAGIPIRPGEFLEEVVPYSAFVDGSK